MNTTATKKTTAAQTPEEEKKPTTGAKKSTSSTSAAKKTTAGKATTGAKSGTAKSAPKTASAPKSTGTTAKKSTSAKGTSTRTTGAKSTGDGANSKAATPASKQKKPTTGAKSTPKATPAANALEREFAPQAEPDAPVTEEPAFVPIALPTGAVVKAGGREVSDAHPPLDFPQQMMRSFFFRLGLILVVLLVLAASAFIYTVRPVRYVEKTSSVSFLFVHSEFKTLIVVEGSVVGEAPGDMITYTENGRGDVCAAAIGDTLYLIRGKTVTPVVQGVIDFVLAADGGALAYRVPPSSLYYRGTGDKDTASLISQNCTGSAYCLSADGRELAFTAVDETGTQHLRVESYSGNRPYIEGTEGLVPVAICDESRYVYYTDAAGGLYVFDRKGAQKIRCAQTPDLTSLIFNRDFTELLFTENGGTVLFSEGERRPIVGVSSTAYLQLLPNRRVASRTLANGTQYMLKTFYKNYFSHTVGTGTMLTYLDRRGNLVDVDYMDGAETVTVTDKGVYFLKTGSSRDLYRVKAGGTESARIEWDVREYCTNVDGSRVAFTGLENALYVWRPEMGATRLCDSIIPGSLTVTGDDLFCFYRKPGLLSASDNGGAVRDIGDGVVHFSATVHTLFFITEVGEGGTFTVNLNYRAARISNVVATGVWVIQ